MIYDARDRDRTRLERAAGDIAREPKPDATPCERPPANGAYSGPARVRTIPPGTFGDSEGAAQTFTFGKAAKRSAEKGREKQARQARAYLHLAEKASTTTQPEEA